MEERERSETVVEPQDIDALEELSEYLDVLSNSARLRILKLLERKPKDVRTISHEIGTSYENTKKHIDRLMSIGVIRKEAGIGRPTSKGVHPVWEYSLVPGALEAIVRSLAIFGNLTLGAAHTVLSERIGEVREGLSAEFGHFPALVVMGGDMDRSVFFITKDEARLGRHDPNHRATEEGVGIVLSDDYRAVSRISKPHARIFSRGDAWFITDAGSMGGTFVNGKRIERGEIAGIADGAIIELSKGAQSARLLFSLPSRRGSDTETGEVH
ncbi:MAG: FHA domain-containing protein [Methanomicrobiales archaeon]|nr:FHA domain-containing protein [Methanomicrobiales archaeon]